ncbi:MAG: SapC family protein, partial [Pseudomonadales bacterium]
MTDTNGANEKDGLIGKMFLYEKPELLTRESHGSLGFTPAKKPFEFVKGVRAVPLTMIEIGSAQRHYPIIFSALENPIPLAVVGLVEQANLFVDDEGRWDAMCYVPTYLRCYPFTFAVQKGGQLAVVVDRNAPSVSESPEYPFFVNGEISEHTDALMQLCAQYEGERKRTQEYCRKLVELDLLTTL